MKISVVFALWAVSCCALASDVGNAADLIAGVGNIERVKGPASKVAAGPAQPAASGEPIDRGTRLETGPGGRIAVIFHDGSRLVLGENTRATILDLAIERGRKPGALLLELTAGTIVLKATGAQTAPDKWVEIRIGMGRISAAGAEVWAGPIEDGIGVVLLAGKAEVRNEAGSVALDKAKSGTLVQHTWTAPQLPIVWSRERLARIASSVALP